jgi:hypothetical protein
LNPEHTTETAQNIAKLLILTFFQKTKSPVKYNDLDDNNNRLDIVILDKTIKEAHLIDVAVPNSHTLHNTITEKPQKYTDLEDDVI